MDKAKLKEALLKATDLNNLYKSKEYQATLLPALKQLSVVEAKDPSQFASREEFARDMEIAFAKASVYAELISLLKKQEDVMTQIRKQIDSPDKNWAGGN